MCSGKGNYFVLNPLKWNYVSICKKEKGKRKKNSTELAEKASRVLLLSKLVRQLNVEDLIVLAPEHQRPGLPQLRKRERSLRANDQRIQQLQSLHPIILMQNLTSQHTAPSVNRNKTTQQSLNNKTLKIKKSKAIGYQP